MAQLVMISVLPRMLMPSDQTSLQGVQALEIIQAIVIYLSEPNPQECARDGRLGQAYPHQQYCRQLSAT